MENRKPETGNAKRKAEAARRAFASFPFPVSGFVFSIFLCLAGVGPYLAAAAPTAPPDAATPESMPTPHTPEGFGKAKFGMTVEQVRQFYPTLIPAPAVTGAASFRSPNMTRYMVAEVDVPGLRHPCALELRFWKNQLWSIIIYYAKNPFPEVVENLRRNYGPPTTKAHDPTWVLSKVTIVTSPAQLWYSFDDNEIGNDVRRAFMEAIQQHQAKRTPAQAGQTPTAGNATPQSGTPAAQIPTGQTPAGQGTPPTPAP